MDWLEKKLNFDPYVGVKLYSFFYDLGFGEIDVNLSAHNMFYGSLKENEKLISMTKAEIGGRNSGYPFEEYDGDFEEFLKEVKIFFNDERVFYYTPLIEPWSFMALSTNAVSLAWAKVRSSPPIPSTSPEAGTWSMALMTSGIEMLETQLALLSGSALTGNQYPR